MSLRRRCLAHAASSPATRECPFRALLSSSAAESLHDPGDPRGPGAATPQMLGHTLHRNLSVAARCHTPLPRRRPGGARSSRTELAWAQGASFGSVGSLNSLKMNALHTVNEAVEYRSVPGEVQLCVCAMRIIVCVITMLIYYLVYEPWCDSGHAYSRLSVPVTFQSLDLMMLKRRLHASQAPGRTAWVCSRERPGRWRRWLISQNCSRWPRADTAFRQGCPHLHSSICHRRVTFP